MEDNSGLSHLGKYGVVGVMIALIMAVMFFGGLVYKISSEHINHSTEVMSELKTLIHERLK